jgi:hypothetical protein
MSQLVGAIGSSDRRVTVDTAGVIGAFYRVADELVRLTGQRLFGGLWDWLVDRGVNGTTAASHADEATLTPHVEVVGVSAFSANGAAQTVSLLGPYTVTFEDSLTNPGVLLEALEAGTIVFCAWIEITTAWDQDPDIAELTVTAGGADHEIGDAWPVARGLAGVNQTEPSDINAAKAAYIDTTTPYNLIYVRPVRIKTAGALRVTGSTVAGATQGEADIYALIATPS